MSERGMRRQRGGREEISVRKGEREEKLGEGRRDGRSVERVCSTVALIDSYRGITVSIDEVKMWCKY